MSSTYDNSLLLSVPDFDTYKASLKSFMQSQTQFKDYNFEGSNLNVMLDLLTYNSFHNAFLTNMISSEMFLESAQLRPSVVSRAKELGYTANSLKSAQAVINIKIVPTGNPSVIVVPAGTAFTSSFGSKSYTFYTNQAYTVVPVNGVYLLNNVVIYEGFPLTDSFVVDNTKTQNFVLSNDEVDTSTINVVVTSNGTKTNYALTKTIIGLNAQSQVFYVQENYQGHYQIQFGDGIISAMPPQNALITVSYQATNGPLANGCNVFAAASAIGGYTNITVTTVQPANGGDTKEDIESIREYAPLLYQSKGRAFDENDYKVILKDAFPEIQSINVFGGEKLNPPQYGKVAVSVDIKGADGVPNTYKVKYANYLDDKTPITVVPIFIDPAFLYAALNVVVYYDYTLTNSTAQDVEAAVISAITNYNNSKLNSFNITFRGSQLNTIINGAHPAINSNDTDTLMSIVLDTNTLYNQNTQFTFGNKIQESSSTIPSVTSTSFKYQNRVCALVDDGAGNIIIQSQNNNGTYFNLGNVGAIDYATGDTKLTPLQFQQIYGNGIHLFAKADSSDISAKLNTILALDLNNLSVTAVPQRR